MQPITAIVHPEAGRCTGWSARGADEPIGEGW